MTTEEIAAVVRSMAGNTIFAVRFTKRTTGEERKMLCRLNVRKHLKGGSAAYDFSKHGLLSVYDVERSGYRSIPLDGIHEIQIRGQHYEPE